MANRMPSAASMASRSLGKQKQKLGEAPLWHRGHVLAIPQLSGRDDLLPSRLRRSKDTNIHMLKKMSRIWGQERHPDVLLFTQLANFNG